MRGRLWAAAAGLCLLGALVGPGPAMMWLGVAWSCGSVAYYYIRRDRRDEANVVREWVAAYIISAAPDGRPDSHLWYVRVEAGLNRGDGTTLWAVRHLGWCLGTDGEWEYEPVSSDRTPEWLAGHRFALEVALPLARQVAPTVVVNGKTAAELTRGQE